MLTPRQEIENAVAHVAAELFGERAVAGPYVRPTLDARHGDFQTNLAMVQAKAEKKNPRELAALIVEKIGARRDILEAPEIAGPGFVNLRLRPDYVADQVLGRVNDPRLGVPLVEKPRTIVVDFGGPNIAKEMHVGHLRSTFLGDALARIYRFQGHQVITDNHLGDWGTQFGKVILGYKRYRDEEALARDPLGHLEALYKRVNAEAKTPDQGATPEAIAAAKEVADSARAELVKLQNLDPENYALWQRFVAITMAENDKVNARLDVRFDHALGESFYNDRLPPLIEELKAKGIAKESQGAQVVEFDPSHGFRDPLIVQKSDGAANYATTDLATIDYRVETFHPDAIIYATDGRQQQHFKQIFIIARQRGVTTELEHVWFGTILGDDKKALKSRSGDPVKLRDLLDEAEARAGAILADKRPELSEYERTKMAKIVGIGALKYADLAQNRNLDYVFNWDKLLAFDGNTAPYLMNAYVRIQSIFRQIAAAPSDPDAEIPSDEVGSAAQEFIVQFKKILLPDFAQNVPSELLEPGRGADLVTKVTELIDRRLLEDKIPVGRQLRLALIRDLARTMPALKEWWFEKGMFIPTIAGEIVLTEPAELTLGKKLLDFADSVDLAAAEGRPHFLCIYLFELATVFHGFYEKCHVKDQPEPIQRARLALCHLTARTLKTGLNLLGIQTLDRM